MKLLLVSDLHNRVSVIRSTVEQAKQVDVVVAAGDFANAHAGLEKTITMLSDIRTPTVVVPGNNERLGALRRACDSWTAAQVLHGYSTTIDGVTFFGIGGGIPVTPFGAWSFDFSEEEAASLLADCPSGCVLVSHSPPRDAVDQDSIGRHLGSRTIRAVIESKSPRLVVCGHIHASAGKQAMIGSTPVVNAGPQGIIWEL